MRHTKVLLALSALVIVALITTFIICAMSHPQRLGPAPPTAYFSEATILDDGIALNVTISRNDILASELDVGVSFEADTEFRVVDLDVAPKVFIRADGSTYHVQMLDLDADGRLDTGETIGITSSDHFPQGNCTIDLIFTELGGSICSCTFLIP